MKKYLIPLFMLVGLLALVGCQPNQPAPAVEEVEEVQVEVETVSESESAEISEDTLVPPPLLTDDYEIVTLLPKDAIPSIDNPEFLTVAEAGEEYAPDELVMGVDIGGERRAYSTSLLSSHEIVNDVVGGKNIAVTW